MPIQPLPPIRRAVKLAALLLLAWLQTASASEVLLKNGMTVDGEGIWVEALSGSVRRKARAPAAGLPYLMIDNGFQRVFVSRRQVGNINSEADLGRYETFKLPQRRIGRQLQLESVGRASDVTPFDEFGRRTMTIITQHGPKPITQGVTKITPKYLEVRGLNDDRQFGLATSAVPMAELDRMLRHATDPKNPDDRMSIARFYLQAGMYQKASAELQTILTDFPELKDRVKQISDELTELQAKQLLAELRLRRDAGQHALAYQTARAFPVEGHRQEVRQQVADIVSEYDAAQERAETAIFLLGQLQSQLDDPKLTEQLGGLRPVITDQLSHDTLNRLDAFLKLAEDSKLSPQEKLALAYSGWILGSTDATTDLEATLRLWNARFLMTDSLREKDQKRRADLLAQLKTVEGVGPEQVAKLVPNLRPPRETIEVRPGEPRSIEVPTDEVEMRVAYTVLLPQEYNPDRAYPLLVTLRSADNSPEDQVRWWGVAKAGSTGEDIPGQAQRHGYIVIAPEYSPRDRKSYLYDAPSHYVVLESIRDARRRFHIDSDRVFLTGHGMGADAAFDIGMSHPDIFAGVVPIAGLIDKYCTWYWENAEHVAWYVVGGELDRNSLEQNTRELTRMMRKGFDVMYVEYIGRGYETYYAEIQRIFEWMNIHRRKPLPKAFIAKVLRPTDDQFYWINVSGFPQNVTEVDLLSGQGDDRVQPMTIDVKSTPANTIFLSSGASQHTIWLSPQNIDFEKRIIVRIKAVQRFNDFVRPDMGTMLEDLRLRGDRETMFWARLDFK